MPLFFQVFDTIGAAAAAVVVALVIMVYATIINTGLITQVLALQLLFRCEKRLVHKATPQGPPPKNDAWELVYTFNCSTPEIRWEVRRDMSAPSLSQPEREIPQGSIRVYFFIFLRRPGEGVFFS